jgi:chlorobactene glucosyltransferase
MLALMSGAIWGALVLYLLYRAVKQFRAYRASALEAASAPANLSSVSIIVPVRNEIDNIENCLAGLTTQTCLAGHLPIIVVDDESEDGTGAVVERQIACGGPVRLLPAVPLPAGWMGKPHACWRGALAAEGDWFCFIDADVRGEPGLVAAAVATAEARGIDMLSLHPFQELVSFWERVVIPAGLLIIACAKNSPNARDRAAAEDDTNGQFLLIRRDIYFKLGGHAAVRAEVCEDKALATRVRKAGFCFRALSAEPLARTRMYRGFASLWEGFSKNAIEILGSPGATLMAAVAGFAVGWTTLVLPITVGAAALAAPSAAAIAGAVLGLLGSSAVVGIHLGTARHFRIPPVFGLFFPLGYTVAVCLAWCSVLSHHNGRVTWKGRTYQLHRKPSPGRT